MDAVSHYVIALDEAWQSDETEIGGKASKLAKLMRAGFRVPRGFCITVQAYKLLAETSKLNDMVTFELGRKPLEAMRWEELWDSALRIRAAFLKATIPRRILEDIAISLSHLGSRKTLAVRSSAPHEDAAMASFAGLHESYVGIQGQAELVEAIRKVWTSLWSDAALMYQRELSLQPGRSAMAVLVQELIEEDVSGVAFWCDPRYPGEDSVIIEAVPGLCQNLVDGTMEPDRWTVKRSSGEVIAFTAGLRQEAQPQKPLLEPPDILQVYRALQKTEALFRWPPDMEWTGKSDRFTVLQARPITTTKSTVQDDRLYYMDLRPGAQRLQTLAKRVADELIPQLENDGDRMAAENLERMDDLQLAEAIDRRQEALEKWRKVYKEEFIPFAHGVRHLGIYYNDAVHPDDPFEFIGLLKSQPLLAQKRNRHFREMAELVRSEPQLMSLLVEHTAREADTPLAWDDLKKTLERLPDGFSFARAFDAMFNEDLDLSYGGVRLEEDKEAVLRIILEMAKTRKEDDSAAHSEEAANTLARLEEKLLMAVGEQRHAEAQQVLRMGRLSWRLRDDDNILLSRIESQLLRAIQVAIERLREKGRIKAGKARLDLAGVIAGALRNGASHELCIEEEPSQHDEKVRDDPHYRPRQLVGQPAAPGFVSGRVRRIVRADDLGRFRAGEILVCDAIQPTMTHLVPLAGAIIERRGGMLIHGAIIARELGIPCVNGIANAVDLLKDGDLVSVDGYLGIVTIGSAEFDTERSWDG